MTVGNRMYKLVGPVAHMHAQHTSEGQSCNLRQADLTTTCRHGCFATAVPCFNTHTIRDSWMMDTSALQALLQIIAESSVKPQLNI